MSIDDNFLTMRDVVLEIRADVKDLKATAASKTDIEDHETRIRGLEQAGFRLSGAWSTVGVLGGVLAGIAGLALGLLSFF
jgi:hypothetical protein